MTDHVQKMLDDAKALNVGAARGMRETADKKREEARTERDQEKAYHLRLEAKELDAEADWLDPPK